MTVGANAIKKLPIFLKANKLGFVTLKVKEINFNFVFNFYRYHRSNA